MKNKSSGSIVETVESKGIKIPIYRQSVQVAGKTYDSYRLAYYQGGARKRERAKTLELARKRAWELIETLADGTAHVGSLTPREHAVVGEALQVLQQAGGKIGLLDAVRQYADATVKLNGKGTIADAVKVYLDQLGKVQLKPINFPDLVEIFLKNIKSKQRSRRYTLDMQARLHKAAKAFKGQIGNIKTGDIDDWLDEMKDLSGRTKNNYRNAVTTLFIFAKKKGYLPREKQTEAEFVGHFDKTGGEIGIYTVDTLKIFLNRIDPRMLPVVAIGAFSGLRSAEIVRLEWPEVRFNRNDIEIKAAKAKTASRRLAPMLPVLAQWLKPFERDSGKVLIGVQDEFALATQFKKAVDAITDENGKPLLKIVPNGFRHSFISYRLAVVKSTAEVALEAGNSPRMIFEHYREVVTADEGAEWFNALPSKARLDQIKKYLSEKAPSTSLAAAA